MKKITKALSVCFAMIMLVCVLAVSVSAAEPAKFTAVFNDKNVSPGFNISNKSIGTAWLANNVVDSSAADKDGKYYLEYTGDTVPVVDVGYRTHSLMTVPSALVMSYGENVELVYNFAESEQVAADTYRFFKIAYKIKTAGVHTLTLVTDADEYVYEFYGDGAGEKDYLAKNCDINTVNLVEGDIYGNTPSSEEKLVAFKIGFAMTETANYTGIFYYGFFQSEVEATLFPESYTYDPDWVEEYEYTDLVKDPDATIAIITDASAYSGNSTNKDVIGKLADWIVDNKDKENIVLAGQVGSLVDGDNAAPSNNYKNAAKAFAKFSDAGIPYFVAAGSNDSILGGADIVFAHIGKEANKVPMTYSDPSSGFNTAYTFKADRKNFLVISVRSVPTTSTISWANELIQANSDKYVIFVIGRALDSDGEKFGEFNNLWDGAIKNNDNVFLVIDGGTMTSTVDDNLVARVEQNASGGDVHIVQANLSDRLGSEAGAILLTKVYDKGTMISLDIYSPQKYGYLNPAEGHYSFEIPDINKTGRTIKTSYNASDMDMNLEKFTFDMYTYKWISALTFANLKYSGGEKLIEMAFEDYTISFKSSDIKYLGVNGYYTFLASQNGAEVYDKHYDTISELAGKSLLKTLCFAQSGEFPLETVQITFSVSKALNNTTLTLVRYNEITGEFETLQESVVSGGYVTFNYIGGTLAILK